MQYNNDCVACGGSNLYEVLSLGEQCPANDLLSERESPFNEYPLGLNACDDCGHGQLTYLVDPSELFKNYMYVSSTSQTMQKYMASLAKFILTLKGSEASVLEIGSNDGLFLKSLKGYGINNFIGIDPAENIVKEVIASGLNSVVGFWPDDKGLIGNDSFDIIIGQNVFAHTARPFDALVEVKNSLKSDGLAIFQTSQADMTVNGEFDTIYHEHFSFFSETSMQALADRAGLKLVYTRYVDMHGTSSLYIMCHKDSNVDISMLHNSADSAGLANIEATDDAGRQRYIRNKSDWVNFKQSALEKIDSVRQYTYVFKENGKDIVAVGAAAKAITFLRAADINPDRFLDESSLKLGKYIAGLDVQISDFSNVSDNDVYIITAWNFAGEIARKLIESGASEDSDCLLYFPRVSHMKLRDLAF